MIKKMIALDWRALKVYHKYGLFWLCHIPIFCFIWSPTVFFLIGLGGSFFTAYPFSLEEKDDLNYLYLTLPIKRSEIVSGRFALAGIIFTGTTLLSTVFIPVIQPFSLLPNLYPELTIGFNEYFTLLSASYLLFAFLNLSIFPFLFKLGYAKGKILGFFLPFVAVMISITFVVINISIGSEWFLKSITFALENTVLINIGMAVSATAILAVSYLLSVKFYTKRDF